MTTTHHRVAHRVTRPAVVVTHHPATIHPPITIPLTTAVMAATRPAAVLLAVVHPAAEAVAVAAVGIECESLFAALIAV